jgi:hypothetical protein
MDALISVDEIGKAMGTSIRNMDQMILRMALVSHGASFPDWIKGVHNLAGLPRYSGNCIGSVVRVRYYDAPTRLVWVVEKLVGLWCLSPLQQRRFYDLTLGEEDAVMYRMNWED